MIERHLFHFLVSTTFTGKRKQEIFSDDFQTRRIVAAVNDLAAFLYLLLYATGRPSSSTVPMTKKLVFPITAERTNPPQSVINFSTMSWLHPSSSPVITNAKPYGTRSFELEATKKSASFRWRMLSRLNNWVPWGRPNCWRDHEDSSRMPMPVCWRGQPWERNFEFLDQSRQSLDWVRRMLALP